MPANTNAPITTAAATASTISVNSLVVKTDR